MNRIFRYGYLLIPAALFFAGMAAGYFLRLLEDRQLALRDPPALRESVSGEASGGAPGLRGASPSRHRRISPGKFQNRDSDDAKPDREDLYPGKEENPFAGRPANELIATIREAAGSRDFEKLRLAGEALESLTADQVKEVTALLLEMGDPKSMTFLAHRLVQIGGEEGLLAVSRIAADEGMGIEFRAGAMEALASVDPERRGEVLPIMAGMLEGGLPRKLEHHAAHIYGRLLGRDAVPGLVDLLEGGQVRPEPILESLRDFVRAGDLPLLTDLLGRTRGNPGQEILLRTIGSAAGEEGSRLLMDYLQNPPAGLRRSSVAWALDEFVRKDDLPALWDALSLEGDRDVQGALARAIAGVGGENEIEKLAQLAADPGSGFSTDALARAIQDTGGKESVSLMKELLGKAKGWEAAEPLAHAIARNSGRQGVMDLLQLAGQGGNEERRCAIIQAIEEFGDPSMAGQREEMFEGEKDQRVSFHLAKAMLRLDPAGGPGALAGRLEELTDPGQRAAIAQVLEKEGNPAFLPTLDRVLRTENDGRAQFQMARTMSSYGSEGVAAVRDILSSDPNPQRRVAVLEGMHSVQPGEALEISRSLFLKDPSPEVRRMAADILADTGGPAALRELQGALQSESDPGIRELIEKILRDR